MKPEDPFYRLPKGYKLGKLIRKFTFSGIISGEPTKPINYDVYLSCPTSQQPDLFIVSGLKEDLKPITNTVFLIREYEFLDKLYNKNWNQTSYESQMICETLKYIIEHKLLELESYEPLTRKPEMH